MESVASQLTFVIIEYNHRIIILIINNNSHKLNFLLLLTKVCKMVKEIFQLIEIMYR